jgi:hypothetical protein
MKISRSYLVTAIALIALVTAANGFTLLGFFQSVEGGSGGVSDRKFQVQLKSQHDLFSKIEDVEDAKKHYKSIEQNFTSLGGGVDEAFQKTYGPVLMSFTSKPKEADERYALIKKRELMEGLVNAYRKEIPAGPIPIRAAYLNILFDVQNSLVNQTVEAEAISLSKIRERFENLKFTAKSFRGDGLEDRIAGLDGVFTAIEKGFEQKKKWKQERDRAISAAESSIGKLAKATIGSMEDGVEASRRFFLYSLIVGVAAFFLALVLLYISHKFVKLKFEAKSDLFLKLLKEFGREKLDPTYDRDRKWLLEDPDWGSVTHGFIESEKAFSDQYQALLSVPKSLLMPYVVFTKDRLAKHWNDTARTLFEIGDKRSTALDDIISDRRVKGRDRADIIDLIRATFTTSREDSFEVDIHQNGSSVPFEILCYPILSGALAGGKIFFFRQIRSEAERVDKAVNGHLHIVRDHIQKVLNGSLEEFNIQFAVHPDVRKTIEDLDSLRRKVSEKEILWKTEAGALIDQIDRQKEVLEKLNNQLKNIREANKTTIASFEVRRGADEDLHSDICFLEKEIEQTRLYRTKLEEDLNMQTQLLGVARKYEVGVRASIGEMERFISEYIQLLNDLRGYCEEAKVQSVNLSFAKDPNSREYGARARAFAFELESFLTTASSIGERLKTIISQHPGSALAPHLDAREADFSMLEGIKNEEERLASFIQRWKVSGEGLIAESKKVSELAKEIDRVSSVATQLGETGLIINEQTHLNLERWN